MKRILVSFIVIMTALANQLTPGIAQENAQKVNRQVVDGIAAVVGEHIILRSEVRQYMSNVMLERNMDENTPPRILQSLFREVLQDMVNERLLLVKATQDSVEVDHRQVDLMEKERLTEIKKQFNNDDKAFQQALREVGLTEGQFRYMIREMMYNEELKTMLMQTITLSISVTPQDMEAWIVANRDSLPEIPEQFRVSHILIYPKVSEKRKEETREKIQDILNRIRNGEDFTELAEEYSQDPNSAVAGGDLGYFERNLMVPEFSDIAFSLNVGEVSDVFETQFGFHIVKVEDIKGYQIRARHILLLLQPGEAEEQACIEQLTQLREDILSGKATFEDMAKTYSDDENSSELGGKLQWLTKGQGIPSFITQAQQLKPGEISEPFKSQFGNHILKLDDYKPAHVLNIKDDNPIIRQLVIQDKNIKELGRILEKLRKETYISIRLE